MREAHCLSLGRVNDSVARVPVVELIIVWGRNDRPLDYDLDRQLWGRWISRLHCKQVYKRLVTWESLAGHAANCMMQIQ